MIAETYFKIAIFQSIFGCGKLMSILKMIFIGYMEVSAYKKNMICYVRFDFNIFRREIMNIQENNVF